MLIGTDTPVTTGDDVEDTVGLGQPISDEEGSSVTYAKDAHYCLEGDIVMSSDKVWSLPAALCRLTPQVAMPAASQAECSARIFRTATRRISPMSSAKSRRVRRSGATVRRRGAMRQPTPASRAPVTFGVSVRFTARNTRAASSACAAAVFGNRSDAERTLTVNRLRGVAGGHYAGGFFGLADVGSVAEVGGKSGENQTTSILNLIQAGNVSLLDVFRTYVYHATVTGVADGLTVYAHDYQGYGTMSTYRETGAAGKTPTAC